MTLRPYQQRAINLLYDHLRNHDGNPCIVMPTGSGKSHVIAEICYMPISCLSIGRWRRSASTQQASAVVM